MSQEPERIPIEQIPAEQSRMTQRRGDKGKGRAEPAVLDHSVDHDFDLGVDGGMAQDDGSPLGQTNEEEQVVEELLEPSRVSQDAEESASVPAHRSSPAMDSDDERTVRKLQPGLQRRVFGQAVPSASASQKRGRESEVALVSDDDDDDDEDYAKNLNILERANPLPARSSSLSASTDTNANANAIANRRASLLARAQALPLDRSESSESAVPLPGTRASAVKKRDARERVIEMSYTPPSGTRAAEMVTLQAEAQATAMEEMEGVRSAKLNLRSRAVRK